MKKLFNDDVGTTYNTDGNAIFDKLLPQFIELAESLANPRELQIVVADTVSYAVSRTCIKRAMDKRKAERENSQTSQ